MPAGEGHAAVGTGVLQREWPTLLVAAEDQRRLEQHGFDEAVARDMVGGQGAVPEAAEHQGVRALALGNAVEHRRAGHETRRGYYRAGSGGKETRRFIAVITDKILYPH